MRRLQPGDVLIEQWDTTRDVYVILDGACRVRDGERADRGARARRLHRRAGGGRLGRRLRHGADRPRWRRVTPCEVLELTPDLLRELLSRSAGARELVERTARERLALHGRGVDANHPIG